MPNNTEKGNKGEELAETFLIKKGYQILDKNWRFKHLELDLVALVNKTLVVVEVKLRAGDAYGKPEDFVSLKKQKNTIKAANAYIIEKDLDYETRFDIISIIQNQNETKIEHIVEAFYPTLR